MWVVASLGLMLALVAIAWVRRLSRKLDALNQSYWELRYDYTRLRSQVTRLDPEQQQTPEPAAATASPTVSFVPLSSMRKKE